MKYLTWFLEGAFGSEETKKNCNVHVFKKIILKMYEF